MIELLFKLIHQFKTKDDRGFTLIELLVIVIIIGLLAVIALPNFIEQVHKSRQTEAKHNLGSINRAQKSERFEKGSFVSISDLPIAIVGKYYFYIDTTVPDSLQASYSATVMTTFENDLLDYSAAVGKIIGGNITSVICKQNSVDGATAPIPPTVVAGVATCSPGTFLVF